MFIIIKIMLNIFSYVAYNLGLYNERKLGDIFAFVMEIEFCLLGFL